MIHPTGIIYFSELADATDRLKIFYTYTGTAGSGLYNSVSSNPQYSGSIYGTGNFYSRSGSGFFGGGTTVNINNATGFLSDTSFTMIITYEFSGSNSNNILFSNYSSGANGINSGFVLGTADTQQPYLEYYTPGGPKIVLSENNWGNKSTLLVTKNTNSITLECLDYNSREFESENFFIDDTYFLPASDWKIGGIGNPPSYFSGDNFKGYMDTFLYYSPAITSYQKRIIKSGLYSNIGNIISGVTSNTSSGITGYVTGLILMFTGYTGQAIHSSSYLPALCSGGVIQSYTVSGISGSVYEQYISGVYGVTTEYYTGYSGNYISDNTEYRKTFKMDVTTYLKDVDNNDLSELYSCSGVDKTNFNKSLVYDRSLGVFILPDGRNLNNTNFYLNGVGQFGSGYSISGNLYNQSVVLSGTYYISGNYLSGSGYAGIDSNIIDVISGDQRSIFSSNLLTSGRLISGLNSGYIFFLNGVKIQNNISSGDISYITGNITGSIFSFPLESGWGYYSGFNNINTSGFSRNTSQLYLNGIRQKKEDDYLEVARISLLNNPSNYLFKINNIYNNNGLYFENL